MKCESGSVLIRQGEECNERFRRGVMKRLEAFEGRVRKGREQTRPDGVSGWKKIQRTDRRLVIDWDAGTGERECVETETVGTWHLTSFVFECEAGRVRKKRG